MSPLPRYYRELGPRPRGTTVKLVPILAVLPWTLSPLPRSNHGYLGKTMIPIPVQLSGPNCLGMSRCRNMLVLKCLGSKLSCLRCVHKAEDICIKKALLKSLTCDVYTDVFYLLAFYLDCYTFYLLQSLYKCCIYKIDTRLGLADCNLQQQQQFFDECIPWWMCYSLLWRGVLGMGDCGWELVAHANSSNVIPAISNMLTFLVSVYAQKFRYQMNTPIFRTRKAQLVMDIYCYAPVESSLSLGRLWTTVCVSFIFPGYRYMHLWVTVQFLSLSYMKLLCYCPFIVSAVSRLFDTCLFMLFL